MLSRCALLCFCGFSQLSKALIHEQNNYPGRGVCSLLQAQSFTWIPPVGKILVLVPRFDRDIPTGAIFAADKQYPPGLNSALRLNIK